MDLNIETISYYYSFLNNYHKNYEQFRKKDPKDIEPSAYFFNPNVFPMDYFDYRKIKKFSFLCVPSKKIVNHAAEKYWNKMFFEKKNSGKIVLNNF
jgi:hypothetical protein